jgi:hypothetical protein
MKQTKRNVLEHICTWHNAESFPLEDSASIYIERKDKHSKAANIDTHDENK